MSDLNILDLNDDCLQYLLSYLTSEDQVNFAQVCRRFRELFLDCKSKHYRQYTIDASSTRLQLIEFCICREAVRTLIIDLDHFDTARTFRAHGCSTPVNCFGILCLALEGMVSLRRLVVKQVNYLVTPVDKPFEQILNAVKSLPQLQILELRSKYDWTFDNLCHLRHLQELYLLITHINTPILVRCCKSSPNLQLLQLGYASVKHKLGDIVSHCQNLETLKFGLMAGPAEFIPLARLPKLRHLHHAGVRKSSSFAPLLKALAARPLLQTLEIDGGTLSPEETLQIVQLHGLRHLKCFCLTADCVESLSQLTELQVLCIWMSSRSDISAALLHVLANCKQLQTLRIAAGCLSAQFVDAVLELLPRIRSVPAQQPLQLEIPPVAYHASIRQLPFRNEVLNCVVFKADFWHKSIA